MLLTFLSFVHLYDNAVCKTAVFFSQLNSDYIYILLI